MLRYLEGTVILARDRTLVIQTGSLGYEVLVPDHLALGTAVGQPMAVWTHQLVRDSEMELFGFADHLELQLFQKLIQVSGVGPRSAIAILSLAPLPTLIGAIQRKESAYLTKVSGVGKKTAEKIILELHDKLGELGIENTQSTTDLEVLEALEALGYQQSVIRDVLAQLPADTASTETRIRFALQILGKG